MKSGMEFDVPALTFGGLIAVHKLVRNDGQLGMSYVLTYIPTGESLSEQPAYMFDLQRDARLLAERLATYIVPFNYLHKRQIIELRKQLGTQGGYV